MKLHSLHLIAALATLTLFAAFSPSAHAYNFTVGYSGLHSFSDTPISAQATFNADTLTNNGEILAYCTDGSFFTFSVKNSDTTRFYAAWNNMTYTYFPIQEATTFKGTLSDGVITFRGETFSRFYNLTGQALTINKTSVAANTSATIDCPWSVTFSGAGTNNYALVSAKTGEQVLTVTDNNKKSFLPSADDIVIYKLQPTATPRPDMSIIKGDILYGDIKSENQDKILYAQNGSPLYGKYYYMATNITLETEWAFSSSNWGAAPKAYLNGECVCSNHSTTHIIAYTINTEGLKANSESGIVTFTFTMSLTPEDGYSGGDCIMRCWDSTISAYNSAPAAHRASISAGTSVATFKFTFNVFSGEWKVEPQ